MQKRKKEKKKNGFAHLSPHLNHLKSYQKVVKVLKIFKSDVELWRFQRLIFELVDG